LAVLLDDGDLERPLAWGTGRVDLASDVRVRSLEGLYDVVGPRLIRPSAGTPLDRDASRVRSVSLALLLLLFLLFCPRLLSALLGWGRAFLVFALLVVLLLLTGLLLLRGRLLGLLLLDGLGRGVVLLLRGYPGRTSCRRSLAVTGGFSLLGGHWIKYTAIRVGGV